MFADEIRRAVEAAPRCNLPDVAAALWRAFGAGQVTEDEAQALSDLIEAKKVTQTVQAAAGGAQQLGAAVPRRVGSRPRTDASMERRRRWAASGRLPPQLAARFTIGEQAVLALVAAESARRKDCRLAVGHMAAIAGVSATTVRNALREARKLGLLTVEERRVTGWRNDTNVVRVVSTEWLAWMRLARRDTPRFGQITADMEKEGGCNSAKGTPTQVQIRGKLRPAAPSRKAAGGQQAGSMRANQRR